MAEKYSPVQRLRVANNLDSVRLYSCWIANRFADRRPNLRRSTPVVICVDVRTIDNLASTHTIVRQVALIMSLSFRIACPFVNHAIPNATIAIVSGQKIDCFIEIALIATIATSITTITMPQAT